MGVTWGDYDHSGRPLYVHHRILPDQPNTLYGNEACEIEMSRWRRGLDRQVSSRRLGTSFFDMENDGLARSARGNGHVYPQMDKVKGKRRYAEPMLLHRNLHNGTFEEVSKAAGSGKYASEILVCIQQKGWRLPIFRTTTSTLPVVAISPKAAHPRDFRGIFPRPAAFETSSNVPLCRLRCSNIGSA